MIEIIGAVPDPGDSYFFGDYPAWTAWMAGIGIVLGVFLWFIADKLDYPLSNWVNALGGVLAGIGLWLPLVLLTYNTHELPVIPIVITIIAIWCLFSAIKKDWL